MVKCSQRAESIRALLCAALLQNSVFASEECINAVAYAKKQHLRRPSCSALRILLMHYSSITILDTHQDAEKRLRIEKLINKLRGRTFGTTKRYKYNANAGNSSTTAYASVL